MYEKVNEYLAVKREAYVLVAESNDTHHEEWRVDVYEDGTVCAYLTDSSEGGLDTEELEDSEIQTVLLTGEQVYPWRYTTPPELAALKEIVAGNGWLSMLALLVELDETARKRNDNLLMRRVFDVLAGAGFAQRLYPLEMGSLSRTLLDSALVRQPFSVFAKVGLANLDADTLLLVAEKYPHQRQRIADEMCDSAKAEIIHRARQYQTPAPPLRVINLLVAILSALPPSAPTADIDWTAVFTQMSSPTLKDSYAWCNGIVHPVLQRRLARDGSDQEKETLLGLDYLNRKVRESLIESEEDPLGIHYPEKTKTGMWYEFAVVDSRHSGNFPVLRGEIKFSRLPYRSFDDACVRFVTDDGEKHRGTDHWVPTIAVRNYFLLRKKRK